MDSSGRCPLRSPWILGLAILAILCVATVAFSDEQTLSGARQNATVLSSGGGERLTGGRLTAGAWCIALPGGRRILD